MQTGLKNNKNNSDEGKLLPTVYLSGFVFSGEGNGKKFVGLPWVRKQIFEKLGFPPFLGTLNLRLTKKSVEKKFSLEKAKGIMVEPPAGFYAGVLFKAYLEGLECGVVLPLIPHYANDVLEIIAQDNLRERLNLRDGSKVTVMIKV